MLATSLFRQSFRLGILAAVFYFYRSYWKEEEEMTAYTMNGAVKGIPTFTNPEVVVPLVLTEKIPISPNTFIFRFDLPSDRHVSGLGPGDHVKIMANIDGKEVSRKYTHVSADNQFKYIDFLIKVYGPNTHPEYPDGGKLTVYLDKLKINDTLDFAGPVGRISYKGNGLFRIREKKTHVERERRFKRVGMVAGGSGLTPLYQANFHFNSYNLLKILKVANSILKNPDDSTEIWLLFANNSPQDVLLKDKLDALAAEYPTRFHVWYTVTVPDANWTYSTGWINKEMLSVYLPSADEDIGVLICGPKGMKNNAVIPNLKALGFKDDQLVIF